MTHNPLELIDAKIQVAASNVQRANSEIESKLAEVAKILELIEDLKAEAALNQLSVDGMTRKKQEVVNAAAALTELGRGLAEVAIDIYRNGNDDGGGNEPTPPTPPTPPTEPEQQTETKTFIDSIIDEAVDSIIADIAEVQPETKPETKPESKQRQKSPYISRCKPLQSTLMVIASLSKKLALSFTRPQNKRFEGLVNNNTTPAVIAMKPSGDESYPTYHYSNNAEKWPNAWTEHLFVLEKALQQAGNSELRIQFPPLPIITPLTPRYSPDGLPVIDIDKLSAGGKVDGFDIELENCKPYQKGNKERLGLKLKFTTTGQVAFLSFDKNSTEYELGISRPGHPEKMDQDSTKSKRENYPAGHEPIRKAAIAYLAERLPEFSSKWESEVIYTVPSTDKQPSNVAANDETVK